VRRDLARLAREGKLTRVHGGALGERGGPPLADASGERSAEKLRIGAAASALVDEGQTVMIDVGTTPLALARHLHGRRLRVITGNLAVVAELESEPEIELIVLGGVLRRNYRSLVGVLGEDALRQLSADVAFLSASGVREDLSVMETTMVEVPIRRGMIAAANRSVLLVDASKFRTNGSIRVCGADELDAVVTDATDDEPAIEALHRAGVEVVPA
jgi:DeoR/GlpR family transcriptional regulator of sugar metabolism